MGRERGGGSEGVRKGNGAKGGSIVPLTFMVLTMLCAD